MKARNNTRKRKHAVAIETTPEKLQKEIRRANLLCEMEEESDADDLDYETESEECSESDLSDFIVSDHTSESEIESEIESRSSETEYTKNMYKQRKKTPNYRGKKPKAIITDRIIKIQHRP